MTIERIIRALLPVLALLSLTSCAGRSAPASRESPTTLTVFAAASLAEPFEEIGRAFSAENPGVEVTFSFAGSQQLARQISEGAPADVFASADQAQMEVVTQAGKVETGAPRAFANNALVVILPAANPAQIGDLAGLAKPGLKLVLAAEGVPAGQYSREFLRKASADPRFGADYETNVLINVVSYEESVRAVLTKVHLGEADAGIVYVTDAAAAQADGEVSVIAVPAELNVIAQYPIAPLIDSRSADAAGRFVSFVLSPTGQEILSRFGFRTSAP